MTYSESGALRGRTPNGQLLTVRHLKPGQSKFVVLWDGRTYSWLPARLVKEEFGIDVHVKKTGLQEGYPSEAVTRAVWRYFVDQHKQGNPDVTKT
jgi:hypothetical protein